MPTSVKHYPAAFINAIAEEGTKAEAVEWLQKTWNELCHTKDQLKEMTVQYNGLVLEVETVISQYEKLQDLVGKIAEMKP